MNGERLTQIENILETAVLRSQQRTRESFEEHRDPDLSDILVLQQERLYQRMVANQGNKPRRILREHGPYLGYGTGLGAILVALFEALGRIFGS